MYKHATELSKYIWSLKDQKIAYDIKWRKVKQARSYSNEAKRCNLCLWEIFFILCRPEMSTLNSRNELVSGCRHAKKFLLKNVLFQLVMTIPRDTSRNELSSYCVLFCIFKYL